MNELFSALDALSRESLQDLLLSLLRHRSVATVLVTHSIEEAVYLAARVYVMSDAPARGFSAQIQAPQAGSAALAVPLGIAAGRVRSLDAVFFPLAYLLYPVPKIALLPVVILLFGIGNAAKVLLVALVLFFAETFFTRYGLGFFIVDSWTRLAYPQMFAGIVAIGLTGFLLFICIDGLEGRYCGWQRSAEQKGET